MAIDYGKTIKKIIDYGLQDEFFNELAVRESKSMKIKELSIAPYIGDAFTEVEAGNVYVGGSFIERAFSEDTDKLTTKLFNSIVKQVAPGAFVEKH